MTWFKLDDQFHSHPKVLVAGNAAIGLYCRLGAYCADKLTDGFIPRKVVHSMGTTRQIQALISQTIPNTRPLLKCVEGGYQMVDYLEYNPTRESVLANRAKAKQRMDKLRGRSSEQTPERTGEQTPNVRAKFERSSPVPVPLSIQVRDIPTPVDTEAQGGILQSASTEKLNIVADHYARIAVEQAHPNNPEAYRRATRKTALEHPDIERYLTRWPTAPPDAIAAWLHGDKHSMGYYHDTADNNVTTIHQLHRGETTT